MMIYKNKRKGMTLSYKRQTIIRQVKEGQYGFSYMMFDSYKKSGGKLTYRQVIASVDKWHKENALYSFRTYNNIKNN